MLDKITNLLYINPNNDAILWVCISFAVTRTK